MILSQKLSIDSVEYATQGNAVLGIRKSGKSYTATFIAERLMDDGIPFIAFDPIGVWRYLRMGKNGPGYLVVVAGENGDLPLTPESAPDIVRAAMKENISLVVDLYSMQLSKADWRTIVERCIRLLLYENKPCGIRHIFIEEAAEFCPQRIGPGDGKVYAEIEKLARMGGNASLGYTLINQRPEEVNKAILELCECLFLHRQKGRHSLTALSKWLDIANTKNADKVMASLPSLERGQCWVWTSGSHEPNLIKIPEKKTIHPDRDRPLEGSPAASVSQDVSQFVGRMTKLLANDKSIEENCLPATRLDSLQTTVIEELRQQIKQRDETIRTLNGQIDRQNEIIFNIKILVNESRSPKDIGVLQEPSSADGIMSMEGAEKQLGKCAKAILTFLAPYDREFSKAQIAVATGYSVTSSYFQNSIYELNAKGLISKGKGIRANTVVKEKIMDIVGPVKRKKVNLETFRDQLGKCEAEIYDVLVQYPASKFTKEQIAAKTKSKYSVNSSYFQNSLYRLNSLELSRRENGTVFLNPELVELI